MADLTTHGEGQEFYRLEAPASVAGRSFGEAMSELKRSANAILIGVADGDAGWTLNPPVDTVVSPGRHLLVIAERDPLDVLEG